MQYGLTSDDVEPRALIGLFGQPGIGKTASLATALGLGNVLHISGPGEGNAAASLADHDIPTIRISSYQDLLMVYAALIGDPTYTGGDDDTPLVRLNEPPDPTEVENLMKWMSNYDFKTIAIDGGVGIQRDIFAARSVQFYGKDRGIGKYSDIADLTTSTMRRFSSIPGTIFTIWITLDKRFIDDDRGTSYYEMAFEGSKSRDIIPPACDFVVPIFTGEDIGLEEDKREWQWKLGDKVEMRDRWFGLRPWRGWWAKGRAPISRGLPTHMPADFTRLYNVFYKPREE